MRKIAFILICALLSGCAYTTKYDKVLNTWHGVNATDLVQKWGAPAEKVKLDNGNTQYVYHYVQKIQKPSTVIPTYITVADQQVVATPQEVIPGETFTLECTTWFEVDQNNMIVSTYAEGNDCVADDQQVDELKHGELAHPSNSFFLSNSYN